MVNVSVMKFDGVEMKGQRGKLLPLLTSKSCDRGELFEAAFAKLKAHNQGEMQGIEECELLYSDANVVDLLRESDEQFVLHKYKEEYGKPHSRITFYLSLKKDLYNYRLSSLKKSIRSSSECEEEEI